MSRFAKPQHRDQYSIWYNDCVRLLAAKPGIVLALETGLSDTQINTKHMEARAMVKGMREGFGWSPEVQAIAQGGRWALRRQHDAATNTWRLFLWQEPPTHRPTIRELIRAAIGETEVVKKPVDSPD